MQLQRIAQAFIRGVDERSGPVMFALGLFVIGVVFGALAVGSLGVRDKQALVGAVADLFAALGRGGTPVAPGYAFLGALGRHLRTVALYWILGITVVGSLGVLGMVLMRGFAAGFAAGFLSVELGWRGMVFSAAALLPHSLLAVPALLLAAGGAVHFSALLAWGRVRRDRSLFNRELARYNRWMAATLLALVAAAVVEAFITPAVMRFASRL